MRTLGVILICLGLVSLPLSCIVAGGSLFAARSTVLIEEAAFNGDRTFQGLTAGSGLRNTVSLYADTGSSAADYELTVKDVAGSVVHQQRGEFTDVVYAVFETPSKQPFSLQVRVGDGPRKISAYTDPQLWTAQVILSLLLPAVLIGAGLVILLRGRA